jgi:hypothetical protein
MTGTVNVISHCLSISGKTVFNAEEVFYIKTGPRERWQSRRINELKSESGRGLSGRKTAYFLNKFRYQENTATATTMRNQLEREGLKNSLIKSEMAEKALNEAGVNSDGSLIDPIEELKSDDDRFCLSLPEITAKAE